MDQELKKLFRKKDHDRNLKNLKILKKTVSCKGLKPGFIRKTIPINHEVYEDLKLLAWYNRETFYCFMDQALRRITTDNKTTLKKIRSQGK